MVSESMATQIAAIAMPDFIERMLNSFPRLDSWRPSVQSRRFENGKSSRTPADTPSITRSPAANTSIRREAVNKLATFWQRR
jgi:hypothetical protein